MNSLPSTYVKPFIPKSTPGRNVTKVVRLRKSGGIVYQDCDVYIGDKISNSQWTLDRSIWHNPFTKGHCEDLSKYKAYIESNEELMRQLQSLRGKRLGHFCKPRLCHGDVLVEILEAQDAPKDPHSSRVENPHQKWEKVLKTGERLVYYKGNQFLFSPSFPQALYHKGKFYCSVRHAFEYERAIYANEQVIAQSIQQARKTSKACALGERVKNLPLNVEIKIMLQLMDERSAQMGEYMVEGKKYLFSYFMYVAQNKKWGIGTDRPVEGFLDDEGLCDFTGQNIMGWINKYIITRNCRGKKGIHYLERLLSYARRTDQMYPLLKGLERVLTIANDVFAPL